MNVATDPVTRGEFSMLAQQVASNERRIESLDTSGTRGVGIVQAQLTDLTKDVAGLSTRLDKHEQEHRQEAADRRSRARWVVGTAIAFFAMIEGPLIWLVSRGK